jgi:hypothetical protein
VRSDFKITGFFVSYIFCWNCFVKQYSKYDVEQFMVFTKEAERYERQRERAITGVTTGAGCLDPLTKRLLHFDDAEGLYKGIDHLKLFCIQ